MELTPAQARAATTLDRHLAVTAGPGSGKTRVLVERFRNILEHTDAGIENIVAITFSNKSASEMRERLRVEFDAQIAKHRKTPDELRWRERKRRLEAAVITTIHGFCSRLLRENPVEAVVDPQFSMLDEYTAGVMLDASAESAVTELIDSDDELGAQMVSAYGRPSLVGHLISVYTMLRGLGISIDEAEAQTQATLLSFDGFRARLDEVGEIVARGYDVVAGEAKPASRVKYEERVSELLNAWRGARGSLEREPHIEWADEFASILRAVQESSPKKYGPQALKDWVDLVRATIGTKDAKSPCTLELAFNDACARSFAPIIFRTLRSMDALYAAEKRNAAALDFDDLQIRVRGLLATHPEVARRARLRYRYFLVDEFQDTNNLQRDIVNLLALSSPDANLFIVGDRKQSIYAFRGAEVDVFSRSVAEIERSGGSAERLATNFRSDPRLVAFFNDFFARLMRPEPGDDRDTVEGLGFVEYEAGEAERSPLDDCPAVELLLDTPPPDAGKADDTPDEYVRREESSREREARRLSARIAQLVRNGERRVRLRTGDGDEARAVRFGDIAILLRAMTAVKTYERALRRLGIPYYVVAGKGFYDREETTDVLSVLEFVDNRADELALAAVLRSPLFGVSDDSLLALRIDRFDADGRRIRSRSRPLFEALRAHRDEPYVGLISADQHAALEEAYRTLAHILSIRNRVPISELIREVLHRTEYEIVAAAAEDGAQRLSNLEKLVAIARHFERGSMRLLRDFIEYVRDFRRLEGRESEASVRSDADAVAILTVHKAKGLEFPVVAIPDLQRLFMPPQADVLFDRGAGLAFKIPDRSGGLVPTGLHVAVTERKALRERFESMRLFYVAATRAEDLLILSGASDNAVASDGKPLRELQSWLHWTVGALSWSGDLGEPMETELALETSRVRLIGPKADVAAPVLAAADDPITTSSSLEDDEREAFAAIEHVRRLLGDVRPAEDAAAQRFTVTALQSYVNCPRQFYYARLLRLPELGGSAAAADRDASEVTRPGSLPASLRGIVIHRFCETYAPGDDLDTRLRASLADVRAARGDAFAEVFDAIGEAAALDEIRPLARNYVESPMRLRVEERLAAGGELVDGRHEFVRSELPFTLRVAEGYVHGTIDKVLLTPLALGRMRATIVDFKTGAVRSGREALEPAIERAALEYRLQMQIYAHAVRGLLPNVALVEATLHFLEPGPGIEYDVPADVVAEGRAARDLDRVLAEIVRGRLDPAAFDARPARRCWSCAFAPVCPEGSAFRAGGSDRSKRSG